MHHTVDVALFEALCVRVCVRAALSVQDKQRRNRWAALGHFDVLEARAATGAALLLSLLPSLPLRAH